MHVIYVLSIGLCFLAMDLWSSTEHLEPKERALSKASLLWADYPMVAAFIILLVYLWIHADAEHQDVFVSGVISCQLVISNVVFVVMEFGFLRRPEIPTTLAKLLNPKKLKAKAPEFFAARFETSKGPFVIEVHRASSPRAADRFYNLVFNGFYDDVRFFRVIPDIRVQFGIHGSPDVNRAWAPFVFEPDPTGEPNARGAVSFVVDITNPSVFSPSQLFINYAEVNRFSRKREDEDTPLYPFGKVTEGMAVVDALYSGYGKRPEWDRVLSEGSTYLEKFPDLDFIRTARLVPR
jgi:peptidyl-prolyl cis-trans isomerase A (cyclophilin A)